MNEKGEGHCIQKGRKGRSEMGEIERKGFEGLRKGSRKGLVTEERGMEEKREGHCL